jgi:hypothetical protein
VNLMLGAHPSPFDQRTLRLEAYLAPAEIPPAPEEVDWTSAVQEWGAMLNDQIGDCAVATPGHLVQAWTGNAAGAVNTIPDVKILSAYSAISGYRPGFPASDRGCNPLAVLKWWRSRGIGGHRISAFADILPHHHEMVRAAIWLFGGGYLGLSLPLSARRQFQAGEVWEVPSYYPAGDARPGSWGGHAVPGLSYDPEHLGCVTWGRVQLMSWEFFAAYAFEVWAVLSADWLRDGYTPGGFDLAALQRDLVAVTG